jgi:hypothetical protein
VADEAESEGATLDMAEWRREFKRQLALDAEADRAEEGRIAELERLLAEARGTARRRHRETRKPVSFTLTDSLLEMLRAEAKRRGLSRSATVSALFRDPV